jgi:protein TonB
MPRETFHATFRNVKTAETPLSEPVSRQVVPGSGPSIAGLRALVGKGGRQAGVSWMLAIGLAFLGTGLAGVGRPVMDTGIRLPAAQRPEPPTEVQDITMADLPGAPTPQAEDETQSPTAKETPPETEPETVLTEEDIVDIPEAPPIEDAMPLLEPKPQPVKAPPVMRPPAQTQPKPPTRPALTPARPAVANTAPREQGNGGGGGMGPGKGGGGKGKFPPPPYPAFARTRGLTGTTTLSLNVSAGGGVNSVSVAGSSGSSELDAHAASWVQSHWRWPAGEARHFRMPVTFRLR